MCEILRINVLDIISTNEQNFICINILHNKYKYTKL